MEVELRLTSELATGLLNRLKERAVIAETVYQVQCTLTLDLEGKGRMAYVSRAKSSESPTHKRQLESDLCPGVILSSVH